MVERKDENYIPLSINAGGIKIIISEILSYCSINGQNEITVSHLLRLSTPDKKGKRDNTGLIILFLHRNVSYNLSLEPSHKDGSNEGSQQIYPLNNKKIIPEIASTTSYPALRRLTGQSTTLFRAK